MDRANLPTNANAYSCRCGNALPHTQTREHYNGAPAGNNVRRVNQQLAASRRLGGSTPGEAGGSMLGNSCHFPAPAPRRIYCAPAPFTAPIGATHQLLVTADGYSKPVTPIGMGG